MKEQGIIRRSKENIKKLGFTGVGDSLQTVGYGGVTAAMTTLAVGAEGTSGKVIFGLLAVRLASSAIGKGLEVRQRLRQPDNQKEK